MIFSEIVRHVILSSSPDPEREESGQGERVRELEDRLSLQQVPHLASPPDSLKGGQIVTQPCSQTAI